MIKNVEQVVNQFVRVNTKNEKTGFPANSFTPQNQVAVWTEKEPSGALKCTAIFRLTHLFERIDAYWLSSITIKSVFLSQVNVIAAANTSANYNNFRLSVQEVDYISIKRTNDLISTTSFKMRWFHAPNRTPVWWWTRGRIAPCT